MIFNCNDINDILLKLYATIFHWNIAIWADGEKVAQERYGRIPSRQTMRSSDGPIGRLVAKQKVKPRWNKWSKDRVNEMIYWSIVNSLKYVYKFELIPTTK